MDYEHKEPLPKHEDRFEDFYVRYDVRMSNLSPGMAIAIDAEVWEAMTWEDDKPVEPLFTIRIGWDGCSHMWMPYLHFDELDEFEAVGRVVKYLREDVCKRHNVVDG